MELGIAALSLSAVAYNVGQETLEVREDKHLDREKKLYVKQAELVVATQIDKGKDSSALKNFLDTKLPKIYQETLEPKKLNT
ncbi:MAG: hypothetical protein LN589_01585, partial [Rickettsia endosymbiont of Eriopis connexa]|nr:hypothetical protein [Rickettsia endosymbiont of Eriopis connexa]